MILSGSVLPCTCIAVQTLTESRMRARFQAEAQQLPESITPILHTSLEGPRCDACGLEIEYEENIMLQCDGPCRNFIHQACAGVRERPRGSWMCQLCKLGILEELKRKERKEIVPSIHKTP